MATLYNENWATYPIGSSGYLWDNASVLQSNPTSGVVKANSNWSQKGLATVTNGNMWGAGIYMPVQYSTQGYFEYSARVGGGSRANLVWNIQNNRLDGVVFVGAYVFQVIPSSNNSRLWLNWQAGIGAGSLLDDATVTGIDNNDYSLKVVHSGTLINAYIDDVLIHSITNSSYNHGRIGTQTFNAGSVGVFYTDITVKDNRSEQFFVI